jgi:hypothetical protein
MHKDQIDRIKGVEYVGTANEENLFKLTVSWKPRRNSLKLRDSEFSNLILREKAP